jgi:hypothetical protein
MQEERAKICEIDLFLVFRINTNWSFGDRRQHSRGSQRAKGNVTQVRSTIARDNAFCSLSYRSEFLVSKRQDDLLF